MADDGVSSVASEEHARCACIVGATRSGRRIVTRNLFHALVAVPRTDVVPDSLPDMDVGIVSPAHGTRYAAPRCI